VSTFHEIGFTTQHRLAVLYTVDPHARARMFASIARLRGWTVKAFEDFEQAVAWLSETAPPQPEAQAALKTRKSKIPVRKAKKLQESPKVRGASSQSSRGNHTRALNLPRCSLRNMAFG